MAHTITLIPGDGIGPEVTAAAVRVVEATGVDVEWEPQEVVGHAAIEQGLEPLPGSVVDSIRKNGIALKGPITTPVGGGFKSVNVQLRQKLDLYANVRPCVSLPGVSPHFPDANLAIFREHTDGLCSGLASFDARLQIADSTARVTRERSDRVQPF